VARGQSDDVQEETASVEEVADDDFAESGTAAQMRALVSERMGQARRCLEVDELDIDYVLEVVYSSPWVSRHDVVTKVAEKLQKLDVEEPYEEVYLMGDRSVVYQVQVQVRLPVQVVELTVAEHED
jgi:hypothetical protein